MIVRDLEVLYAYSYWANGRLIQVISQMTPDEFARPVAGSYGSIRNTLVHVLSAEWGWLERCGGHARGPRLNPEDYPTVESLVAQWTRVEGYLRAFLATLKDEDLDRPIEFSIGESTRSVMTLGELLHHGAVHGVHHRGQVALLLRLLGRVPGNFDILFYYAELRGVAA